MNKITQLYKKIESEDYTFEDLNEILNYNSIELKNLLELTYKITKNNFDNMLKIYNPMSRFPAISLTGNKCTLQCEHCDKVYLDGMKHILTNEHLEGFLENLSKNEGTGVLLSGGCDPDGSVPLFDFLDTIKKVKGKTNLIFNVHTGLLNEMTAQKLAEANIDIISFDINMDEDIIHNIYHLEKGIDDYKKAIKLLEKYKLNIVPHVCIGLYYGKIHKELESIKFIKKNIKNPSLIVFIALIPPKKSTVRFETPEIQDIAKIIALTRLAFPKTEISLGCMRPRKKVKVKLEKFSIKAGVNRIEIPSAKTLQWLKKDNPTIKLKFLSACCAIPEKFENFVKSKPHDIKRYQIL